MNQDTRDLITWVCGTLISVSILAGLAVKFVLLPWLRDHLVVPMRQVEKQVSENSHKNQEPTVLDRIDDVSTSVKALARVIDSHLEWSDRWVDVIEREIGLVKERAEMAEEKRKQ